MNDVSLDNNDTRKDRSHWQQEGDLLEIMATSCFLLLDHATGMPLYVSNALSLLLTPMNADRLSDEACWKIMFGVSELRKLALIREKIRDLQIEGIIRNTAQMAFDCSVTVQVGYGKLPFRLRISPLRWKGGRIQVSCCRLYPSPQSLQSVLHLFVKGEDRFWSYDMIDRCWTESPYFPCSSTERRILHLSACGCSQNEVAKQMNMSVDTVKYYRQQLFHRFRVTNISEALAVIINTMAPQGW